MIQSILFIFIIYSLYTYIYIFVIFYFAFTYVFPKIFISKISPSELAIQFLRSQIFYKQNTLVAHHSTSPNFFKYKFHLVQLYVRIIFYHNIFSPDRQAKNHFRYRQIFSQTKRLTFFQIHILPNKYFSRQILFGRQTDIPTIIISINQFTQATNLLVREKVNQFTSQIDRQPSYQT